MLIDFIVTGQLQEMEMIRQKVYSLEQAQIKMKQEFVPLRTFRAWVSDANAVDPPTATKLKFESCGMSLSRAAFKPSLLTLVRRQRMLAHPKHRRRPSDTARAIYSAGLWLTKEVLVPVLPLPLPRISSRPSQPSSSLLVPPSKEHRRHRRAPLEDIKLALL